MQKLNEFEKLVINKIHDDVGKILSELLDGVEDGKQGYVVGFNNYGRSKESISEYVTNSIQNYLDILSNQLNGILNESEKFKASMLKGVDNND